MGVSYLFTISTGHQLGVGFEAIALEGFDVAAFVIRLPILPHSPNDPLPLPGLFSECFIMAHALAQLVVTAARPSAEFDRAARKFMPALPLELGATPAQMHPVLCLATFLGHWGNATGTVDGQRIGMAAAVGAQGGEQARGQRLPGAGQALG